MPSIYFDGQCGRRHGHGGFSGNGRQAHHGPVESIKLGTYDWVMMFP
ncbi:hypothetical protein PATSB16_24140 [Pandoraea thiooxydans]|nr:hypothetical protein PATSB16_24140 [Pandoraea thiooxydans]